mgnify:CR=1 FL=1
MLERGLSYHERISSPDTREVRFHGKVWTPTHGKLCAQCGETFYGYIAEDLYWMPYRVDDEPELRNGMASGLRGTCGRLDCYDREVQHQLARSPAYLRAVEQAQDALNEKRDKIANAPKLKKLGGM